MSLEDLASVHTADVYDLGTATDALAGTVESLGSARTARLDCRFVPMSRRDSERYGATGENEMYKVLFAADPELDPTHALVWNDRVWRVREVINSGGIDMAWHAVVEHAPQVELSAP